MANMGITCLALLQQAGTVPVAGDTDIQAQTIQLCVTVVFRQLNGKQGAVDVLDVVRRILGGYTPPNCRRRIWLTREVFIGEVKGLWQYALDFATESVFIEDSDLPSGPLLTEVNYEESE